MFIWIYFVFYFGVGVDVEVYIIIVNSWNGFLKWVSKVNFFEKEMKLILEV